MAILQLRKRIDITPEYKIDLARQLRQRQTLSEERLWEQLRNRRLNSWKFRRQHPLGRFVADFCCEHPRLIIEIDGGYHNDPEQQEWDREREAHFTGRGYTVLRLSVEEVMADLPSALARIRSVMATLQPAVNRQE